jgi:hypothetical protein
MLVTVQDNKYALQSGTEVEIAGLFSDAKGGKLSKIQFDQAVEM